MNAIETRALNFRYPHPGSNGFTLRTIDFAAQKGHITAILGENGAGKSTLLKQFNGLLEPTSGTVLVNGEEITDRNRKSIRRKVGFVFQNSDDQLFMPTVRQDVSFGPMNMGLETPFVENRVERALKIMGIQSLSDRPTHQLSTGEKKRVCIAGVLAMEPEILVLDEPTANLDPKGVSDMLAVIRQLNTTRNITVILATHNVNIVPDLADLIYVMSEGTILDSGTPNQIFANEGLLSRAKLDLPEVAKLMLKLRSAGYRLELSLNVNDAFTELKKILDDGHA